MVGVTTSMGFEVLIRIVPMSMVMNIDMMNLMLGWLRKQSRLILEMYSPLSQGSWRGDTAGSLGVSPHPMGCRRGPTSNPSAVAAARTGGGVRLEEAERQHGGERVNVESQTGQAPVWSQRDAGGKGQETWDTCQHS